MGARPEWASWVVPLLDRSPIIPMLPPPSRRAACNRTISISSASILYPAPVPRGSITTDPRFFGSPRARARRETASHRPGEVSVHGREWETGPPSPEYMRSGTRGGGPSSSWDAGSGHGDALTRSDYEWLIGVLGASLSTERNREGGSAQGHRSHVLLSAHIGTPQQLDRAGGEWFTLTAPELEALGKGRGGEGQPDLQRFLHSTTKLPAAALGRGLPRKQVLDSPDEETGTGLGRDAGW
ncbi:hypothetical protein LZ30DRAFT_738718 [Colletotrichum cereale]|nr:hypothetical protein LZ30DRAFT_738718 [Colletotrichum cereale]